MACKDCKKTLPCKRHRRKSRASSTYTPNLGTPPPYGFTFPTTRPDGNDECSKKTYSFAESNLGSNIFIGTEVGVRHKITIRDNNNSIKLEAIFTVGTPVSLSDIIIGSLDMIVAWFQNEAIITIDPSKILLQSSGFMEHLVEYQGDWSSNFDVTEIKRWQVDFIYQPPVSIANQPDSLWVDDGCTIDFTAQNVVDERVIESTTQINGISNSLGIGIPIVSIPLVETSGVPTNLNYTSEPIISTTNIVIVVGDFAPKFTISNTGHPAGYVKVEWGSNIEYVPANSQRSYIIDEGTSVKTTWLIINPITGVLDPEAVNVSNPTYAFPPRIVSATFNSVIQAGVDVPTIADEGTIKRAREFDFVMPNANYTAEIVFREIEILLDYDFENPICSDNTSNGLPVTTIKDRINRIPAITQITPSLRGTKQSNYLSLAANQKYNITYPLIDYIQAVERLDYVIFVIAKQVVLANSYIIKFDVTTNTFGQQRLNTTTAAGGKLYATYSQSLLGAATNIIPNFATYLNQKFIFSAKNSVMEARVAGIDFSNTDVTHITTFSPALGVNIGGGGATDLYRILETRDALTLNERAVIYAKLREKYSI